MKAYVINLARSPDRREHMVRELSRVGIEYEFVDGVDGKDLDLSDSDLVDPTWQGKSPFWPGVAGCYLSHRKVFQKVVEANHEHALVLEDDVVLPADLTPLVAAASTAMAEAEAVLLQYFSCTSADRGEACQFLRHGSMPLPRSRVLAIPADIGELGGTGAYLITRDACQRMLETMLPISVPIDDWEFFVQEGAIESVRCVVPIPVRIQSSFRTTIDHYGHNSLQTRLRKAITRVPLFSQALTMRRQRIMDRKTQVQFTDGL